jgi:hypothetical protein
MLKGCAEKLCICKFCIVVVFMLINTYGKFFTFIFAVWWFIERGSLE